MTVVPLDLARLRRARDEGDVRGVVRAAEKLLDGPWRSEAVEVFYGVFWACLEGDTRLQRRAGALDLRIGREAIR